MMLASGTETPQIAIWRAGRRHPSSPYGEGGDDFPAHCMASRSRSRSSFGYPRVIHMRVLKSALSSGFDPESFHIEGDETIPKIEFLRPSHGVPSEPSPRNVLAGPPGAPTNSLTTYIVSVKF
ncbi:hypothetical protein YC2023_089318 [Brassica napus]